MPPTHRAPPSGNGRDDDCDGLIDEGLDDVDADGFTPANGDSKRDIAHHEPRSGTEAARRAGGIFGPAVDSRSDKT